MGTPPHKWVHVAVGVIIHQDEILISQRKAEAHQGGLWEFPGGKVEPGESVQQALSRELQEELGISPSVVTPLFCVKHQYSDKWVCLDIWAVQQFSGEPYGLEGQAWKWVKIQQLLDYQFPKANQMIIDFLLKDQNQKT